MVWQPVQPAFRVEAGLGDPARELASSRTVPLNKNNQARLIPECS
jgi:hypothetical protein